MELSKQVCSLELSQKLKELGVKQESLFYFYSKAPHTLLCEMRKGMWLDEDGWPSTTLEVDDLISAFTVAELGELLPYEVEDFNHTYRLHSSKENGKYVLSYLLKDSSDGEFLLVSEADTEADARAKCLVYLLENKLITL